MPGMDPKQIGKMMSQLGIKSKHIEAKRVVIETEGERIIIEPADVVALEMQGQTHYQVAGKARVEAALSEDDVKLIMEQTGSSEKEAQDALTASNGDIAQAILALKKE